MASASARLSEPMPLDLDGAASCQTVLAELERILGDPVFRNSKRCSSLLRHVVERALNGHPEALKERTIGIEVFDRAPDYDTNADHVVRSVAGEVRRRLAQYYVETGRDAEVRIYLLAGSYVPQFRMPVVKPVALTPLEVREAPALEALSATVEAPTLRRYIQSAPFIVGILAAVALASLFAFAMSGPRTPVERFWSPVFASSKPTLLCFGGRDATLAADADEALTTRDFERQPSRRMHTSDALALVELAGLLQSKGRPYRVLNRAGATSFRDLQTGPFVLIGAMNNEWTLRLTRDLRFSFERQTNGARILDKQNPSNTAWALDFTTPIARLGHDYAIVSRVHDPQTEQTAVMVAGIGSWGTLAAAEFVTSPDQLKKLAALAPAHWEDKNLQVVISTDVIRASSGPPNILAAHFW